MLALRFAKLWRADDPASLRAAFGSLPSTTMLDVRPPTGPTTSPNAPRRHVSTAPIVLACWALLVVVAVVWGHVLVVTHHHLDLAAPPFWSPFRFHPTARLIPAVVVAALVVRFVPDAVQRMRWGGVLALTAAANAAWAVTVAFVDSIDGRNALTDPLRLSRNDYLQTARTIGSLHGFLSRFTDVLAQYPQNSKGHPPGMIVIEWTLDKIGLASAGWSAALVVAAGVAAGIAALVALARDRGRAHGRAAAAPFMILLPAVIWWQTADAFFAGVAAWSVTALVLATAQSAHGGAHRRLGQSTWLALAGGVGFGVTAFLSYGLVLLGPRPDHGVRRTPARRACWPSAAIGAMPGLRVVRRARLLVVRGLRRDSTRSTGPGLRSTARIRTSSSPTSRCSRWRPVRPSRSRCRVTARPSGVGPRRRSSRRRRVGRRERDVEGRGRTHLVAVRAVGRARDGGVRGRRVVRCASARGWLCKRPARSSWP